MSFFTSLHFYRPSPPPLIRGVDLASFMEQFAATGAASVDRGLFKAEVKFGCAIDQDHKPASWVEWSPKNPQIGVTAELEWDVGVSAKTLAELIAVVSREQRSIYRAHIMLGSTVTEVLEAVHRQPSTENSVELVLDDWSLEIGPVECSDMDSETVFQVGWTALNLSGPGYLYPWTFRDLIKRAEANEGIQRCMSLCRRFWPVTPSLPRWRTRRARKKMGRHWPYDAIGKPMDWYWGLSET